MAYTQRTADWVIQKAYLHANRKATPPTSGNNKYEALLDIVDSVQKLWEEEDGVEWNSLYSLVTLSATITATDTFALSTSINYLSRRETVKVTNGTNTSEYTIVDPENLYDNRYSNAVAKVGRNLQFSKAFVATDSVFGYNIKVPAITFTNDISTGTDLVQVDDPMWLAYMCAYEFVRNDIVKRNTRDDLLQYATQVMNKMKRNNRGGVATVPLGSFISDQDTGI